MERQALLQHFEKREAERRKGMEKSSLISSTSTYSARLAWFIFPPIDLKDKNDDVVIYRQISSRYLKLEVLS